MKTLKNRILSGAMAGALALSLAVPAFASNSTDITGTYQAVTIDVTVPTSGTAQINPTVWTSKSRMRPTAPLWAQSPASRL